MIKFCLYCSLFVYTLFADELHTKVEEAYKHHNIPQVVKLYKQIALEGDLDGYFRLGILYYQGKYIKKNLDKAMEYFQEASIYGDKKALYNIATIYSNKSYHDYNPKKAYKILLGLAREHYPKAQFRVGSMLLYGFGVGRDYKLAMRWFEEAYFVHHYILAGCSLAYMYANGLGALQNLGRARKLSYDGAKQNIYLCKKVYNDFKLYKSKYKEDKGFKFGYYKSY